MISEAELRGMIEDISMRQIKPETDGLQIFIALFA